MNNTQILDVRFGFSQKDCAACGIVFFIPTRIEERCSNDGRKWWCPGCGHQWHYGESESDKLKRELERERELRAKEVERERQRREQAETEAKNQRNITAAYKGHLTRTKKRVGKGVCPCCNRTFSNLARHMAGKHPYFADESES